MSNEATGTERRWSISAVEKYEECPKSWHYRYVEKPEITEPDAEHLRKGTAVHSAFEAAYLAALDCRVDGTGTAPQMVTAAAATLGDAWAEQGLPPEGAKDALDAVLRTLAARAVHHERIIGVELQLDGRLDSGVAYIGYADLVEWGTDGASIEVVDWKTGKQKLTAEVHHSFQLNLYGWHLRRIYGDVDVWASEVYPFANETVRTQLAVANMSFAAMRLDAGAEGALADIDYPPKPGPLCRWCPYMELCPAMTRDDY